MKFVKVLKSEAQEVKRVLEKNRLFNHKLKVLVEDSFVLFPVIDDKKINTLNLQVVERSAVFSRVKSFDDLLKDKLGEDYSFMRHSFDVVGDIAILEIPRELEDKSKIIGEMFLETHKNIKTVVKKVGAHEGDFRIQKFEVIAGEKKFETTYVENGCRFMLDISKVYFSPRLSTERMRIAKQVKVGEEVLVMFSGYSPHPITILKHSHPRRVYAVELNPEAHKYALINRKLNHIPDNKLLLYNGDVVVEVPKIVELRKPVIGIKSCFDDNQLTTRLALNPKPKLIEFRINEGDLENRLDKVKSKIEYLRKLGIKVVLHQPSKYKSKVVSLSNKECVETTKECYKLLFKLTQEYDNILGFVIHPYKFLLLKPESKDLFIKSMKSLLSIDGFNDKVFVENIAFDFYSKPQDILKIARDIKLKNMCFDFAHFMIANNNQDLMFSFLSEASTEFNLYFHIADSNSRIDFNSYHGDNLPIGEGKINFSRFIKFIDVGIIEITSSNEITIPDAKKSYLAFQKLIPQRSLFDRIVMPLPKTGNYFLKTAFSAIRDGGVIHFYYFLKEEDLPSKGWQIIQSEAEKYDVGVEKLGYSVCGQVGKRLYRVCFDFKVRKV